MLKQIRSFSGEYRLLSNFHSAEIRIGGRYTPTVEHAYQACKTLDRDDAVAIMEAVSPGKAKRLGRDVELRADWDQIKISIMFSLLMQKFSIHRKLLKALIATEDARLVEGNDWGDTFWGVSHGRGSNKLGILLMSVRSIIKTID